MSPPPAGPGDHCPSGAEPEQLTQLLAMKTVKLILALDGKEFNVHQGFLSRLSDCPNAFVDDGAEEAAEGCITLEDIDIQIFSRIAQFVYSGTYAGFAPTALDEGTKITEDGDKGHLDGDSHALGPGDTLAQEARGKSLFGAPLFDIFRRAPFGLPFSLSYEMNTVGQTDGRWHFVQCKHCNGPTLQVPSKRRIRDISCDCDPENESKKKRDFISAFMAKQGYLATAGGEDPGRTIWQNTGQTKPADQTKSFEHVFIGHARIWSFAHRYSSASLMDLAYSRLGLELMRWTISASAFVPDFGGLVRYVYDRTARKCRLRLLVAEFAACVVEDVSRLEGWSVLLDEVPEFMADLISYMTNRLC